MNSTVAMDCIEDNPSQSGVAGSVINPITMDDDSECESPVKISKRPNTTDKLYLTLLLYKVTTACS